MYAIPSYATVITVTVSIIVVAVMASISYIAVRRNGSERRSALDVALGVGAILAAWLAVAAAAGGAEVFLGRTGDAVPAIAGGVLIPILVGVLITRIGTVRDALAHPPVLALLTLANSWRVVGVVFITLYLQNLLPAQFALPAGIGDVAVGLAAPFVAYALWKRPAHRRPAIIFHTLGLLDLATAIALGVTSAPGILQIFTTEPSTLPMTVLPEVLVPTFLVPIGVIVHITALQIFARPPLAAIRPNTSTTHAQAA